MPPDDKDISATPAIRQIFARRLRELRVLNGYKTARSLARSIGIDENRYTRYERAEVEPDLTLLTVLAATLRTTPNELLGIAGGPATGLQDSVAEQRPFQFEDAAGRAQLSRSECAKAICWTLATAIAEAVEHAAASPQDRGAAGSATEPRLQAVSAGYQQLSQDPFGALTTIVNEPAVVRARPELLIRIRSLVEDLARILGQTTP